MIIVYIPGIRCHEWGNMYDGTNFLGIEAYDQCQFFETEFMSSSSSNKNRRGDGNDAYMRECPEEDQCCFSLREYMSIDFWGRE